MKYLFALVAFAILTMPLFAPDMDLEETHYYKHHWHKDANLPAGTRLRIVINESNVIYDKTVPAGYTFDGSAEIDGWLIPE